jgi:hypothetical protein
MSLIVGHCAPICNPHGSLICPSAGDTDKAPIYAALSPN